MKQKLKWFGHVSRSSDLAKTILQGTVKGKRRRGGQKKRCEDNFKEWTRMDLVSSARAAENRTRWKGVVANLSAMPRQPSITFNKDFRMIKSTSTLCGKICNVFLNFCQQALSI